MKKLQSIRFSIYTIVVLALSIILYSCQSEQKIEGGNPVGPGGSGTIKIISPNGGESIIAGSQFEITWTGNGVGTVLIEYTTDNGVTWLTIIADYPNTGSYLWDPVPNNVSNGCLVRISTSDNQFSDQSDRPFGITSSTTKSLNITRPNGGEELFVGQSYSIKWISTGVQNVKIEYSSNAGSTWTTIAGSYPADSSSYLWSPVPNFPSTQCLVRLTAVEADSITSVSGTVFTITATRSLTVTSPNGGETWTAGTSQMITWTSDNINEVKIEYTTNNGDTWNTIIENTTSDGSYTWNPVPNTPTTAARIRVTDALNGVPDDISDGSFTITGAQELAIISPNGGENWPVGSSQLISWTSSGPNSPAGKGKKDLFFNKKFEPLVIKPNTPNDGITDIKLEFSTDAGATWQTIVETTPNVGSFVWQQLPEVNSSLCRVKISDAADGLPSDLSDDNFTITTNSTEDITITAPNGGEEWEAGTSEIIKWNSTSVSNVKIEYTINNGVNWITIVESTPSDGFYTWDPIPNTPSTNSRLRISDVADGFPVDMSDNFFSITPESNITVLTPNGGETVQAGSSQNITWNSVNIADVKIEYTTNGGASWNTIISSTPSDGHFIWDPVPVVNSTICRIKISDASDGLPTDISDENFTITDQTIQTIEVTAPNGGESWLAGTTQNITWNATGIPAVDIEYTTDNGLSWTTVITGAPGSGSFEWTPIPDVNSTQCRVRIKDNDDGSPFDQSDAVFTIHPVQDLSVITPNGGEVYVAGDPVEISWNSQGVENVKIEYTINNGILPEDWFTLTASTPSDGYYVTGFSIPSELYRIRISDADDGAPMDESDGTFTVLDQPYVKVLVPNGGEQWLVGETYEIRWESSNIEFVKIEYTTNGGFSWNVITESTPGDGIYEQFTPTANDQSENCKIRISDANDGVPSDDSDGFFSIYGGPHLSVVFPNGGEHIDILFGPDTVIVWTTVGVANVGIDYSLDNGVTWTSITTSTPSTGAFRWTLPTRDNASSLARIRVYDASDPSFRDVSDASFYLNMFPPGLRILNFSRNEQLKTGKEKIIKWSGSEEIRLVKIEYSPDGGKKWLTIEENVATIPNQENSFVWRKIPDSMTKNAQIRISSTGGRYSTRSEKFTITR